MIKLNIRNLRLADFVHNFNKTRQRFSDVILQEGGRSYCYSDASQKKITSELAEVSRKRSVLVFTKRLGGTEVELWPLLR